MPYTTVVAGTTITASWANLNVRNQVVTPFASSAARTSSVPSPVDGMHSFLNDYLSTEYYSPTSNGWFPVAATMDAAKVTNADVTSSGAEVALTSWSAGPATVTFINQHMYELRLLHSAYNTGTANAFFDNKVRVRKTVNSTSAQELGSWRVAAGGGTSPITSHTSVGYAWNVSGADISASLGLTCEKMTGTNAILTSGAKLIVFDLGEVSRLPLDSRNALTPVAIV